MFRVSRIHGFKVLEFRVLGVLVRVSWIRDLGFRVFKVPLFRGFRDKGFWYFRVSTFLSFRVSRF